MEIAPDVVIVRGGMHDNPTSHAVIGEYNVTRVDAELLSTISVPKVR
jgi:hypothetical protein